MNSICKRAPKVLLTESGQELVRAYNEVTSTLVSYEITVYQTWVKLVSYTLYTCLSHPFFRYLIKGILLLILFHHSVGH
ncbi:unnamed protein product [Trichobilharzia regenti]|nr:unnamed protein product [Trichobilharzia regenti]